MRRIAGLPGPGARAGKKQVLAYLAPEQAEAARKYARADDGNQKTLQEVVGEALNAVFRHHGMADAIISGRISGHVRVVRRSTRSSALKKGEGVPACREGRMSLGGWFPTGEVNEVTLLAQRLGVSIQTFVEAGVRLVTGVEPPGGAWKVVLDPESIPARRPRGRPPGTGVSRRPQRGGEDSVLEIARAIQRDLR